MLELRRWWAARSYLETCCLFCLSAHSPLPPAPRRPRRAARLHPPLAVADGAAGAGDCGGGPLLSALLHDELLWQGGGCNGAGRDAQVVGGKQRCLKGPLQGPPHSSLAAPRAALLHSRMRAVHCLPLHQGLACCMTAWLPHGLHGARCIAAAACPPARPPAFCTTPLLASPYHWRPLIIHPLHPRLAAGTKTARCGRWCWRTRQGRTRTPAPCTSMAATTRCRATRGRHPSTEGLDRQQGRAGSRRQHTAPATTPLFCN